jgi:hypothetical protein
MAGGMTLRYAKSNRDTMPLNQLKNVKHSDRMDSLSQKRVSSPISTGGEGVFFEQHVAAYWLAQLLVRSIPPILTDRGVTEVHLQTEHLGFNTDDFLIVCAKAGAPAARLVGQVKRSFTISAADEECKKAIGDFWKDFKKADPFNPEQRSPRPRHSARHQHASR